MSSRRGFPIWWPDHHQQQQQQLEEQTAGCCSCSGLTMAGRCLATHQLQHVNEQPHHSYSSLPPTIPPSFYTNDQIDNIALYPLLFRPGFVPTSNLNISYNYGIPFRSMEGSEEHAPHDMAAQQEAAREYRPEIQVISSFSLLSSCFDSFTDDIRGLRLALAHRVRPSRMSTPKPTQSTSKRQPYAHAIQPTEL